jgi:hypothetical protein
MTGQRTRQIRISIEEFIEDIRRGITDDGLMSKYGMGSQKTLSAAFDRLIESGRVTREELNNRGSFITTQAIADILISTNAVNDAD